MFSSRFFTARHWDARVFSQAGAEAVAATLAIYEALVYCQLSPAYSTNVNLSPGVQLKTNLSPSANVDEALTPTQNVKVNMTPSEEVNSS